MKRNVVMGLKSAVSACCVFAAGCGTLVGNPSSGGAGKNGANQIASVDPTSATGSTESVPRVVATDPHAGSVAINLSDAPIDGALHVYLQVTGLQISTDGKHWAALNPGETPQRLDLLAYQNGLSAAVSDTTAIDPGTYFVRLALSSTASQGPGTIVLSDGSEWPLSLADADRSSLQLATPITIGADQTVQATIDFDLRKSVSVETRSLFPQRDLRFHLKPRLRMALNAEAGSIKGHHAGGGVEACAFPDGEVVDQSADCPHALSSAKVVDGSYVLPFLPVGHYEVAVYRADGSVVKTSRLTVSAQEESDDD